MSRIAIFGDGRVGTALQLEAAKSIPVYRRGEDAACDLALICWPAHAVAGFAAACPQAARAHKLAFCNGCWAVEDGADEHGCCYVRAAVRGDRASPNYKGWRVYSSWVAEELRAAGLGVVCSRDGHLDHVWGKALYLLPIALTCADLGYTAREIIGSPEHAEWFDAVLSAGQAACGNDLEPQVKRARFLCERTPFGWRPSPSEEELDYFRGRLCAAS